MGFGLSLSLITVMELQQITCYCNNGNLNFLTTVYANFGNSFFPLTMFCSISNNGFYKIHSEEFPSMEIMVFYVNRA